MKDDKLKPKSLLKGTQFATFDSGNEDDILAEILIANLICHGLSFDELFGFIDLIENKKDKVDMEIKVTNIILDFISLNPEYAEILKRNNKVYEFLSNFGLDFYH